MKENELTESRFKKGNCAMLGCELKEEDPTLGDLLKKLDPKSQGYDQAKRLIKEFGYKKTDKLCEDCFWK